MERRLTNLLRQRGIVWKRNYCRAGASYPQKPSPKTISRKAYLMLAMKNAESCVATDSRRHSIAVLSWGAMARKGYIKTDQTTCQIQIA